MIGDLEIWWRDGALHLQGYSRTVDWIGLANGWLMTLPEDAENAVLGKAILDGLAQTEDNLPSVTYDVHAERLKEFLKKIGAKSYGAFVSGTRSAGISIREPNDDVMTITPMRNGGNKGANRGFRPILEKKVVISVTSSEEELGRAVREALTNSE